MVLRFFVILFVFLVIDALWLGVVAKRLYQKQLGFLMKKNVNWFAAILFYLVFVVGLLVFVVNGAVAANDPVSALMLGGLFGLVAYSTYDLTNLSTVKDWPIIITIIDLIWGTAVSALTSWISVLLICNVLK